MSFTLLLILFNVFTSVLYEGLNSQLKDQDMTQTKLTILNLTANQTETLHLYKEKKNAMVYLSIVVLGDAQIKVNSSMEKILDENKKEFSDFLQINYSISEAIVDDINLKLTPNKDVQIEITNIIQDKFMEYQEISYAQNNVTKNNFVLFLNDTKNKYKVSIKFNKDSKPISCYYNLLRLPTNDFNYILPASKYNKKNNQCKEDYEFRIGDIKGEDKNKKHSAFIFSIEENKLYNYSVTINITQVDEAMTIFLYISIGLAGVFAVITFFLIRRKQSIDTKNDDNQEDLYNNEENKEEQ